MIIGQLHQIFETIIERSFIADLTYALWHSGFGEL